METIALSGFLSGFATAYFALHTYQLFSRKNSSRMQRVVAFIFVQWALFNLKDFVLTIHEYNDSTIQSIIILIDGTSLIGYTCFIYELISPGWATLRRVVLMATAYVPFLLAYLLRPYEWVIHLYLVFLFLVGAIVFLYWLCKAHRYVRYIRENFSNIDEIDISWLRVVAWFFVICQLLWVVISIVRHPLTDCLYYVMSIILWQVTLEYVLNQKPVTMEPYEPVATREYSFAQTLPSIIEDEALYLNPTLSIKDLAQHIGTNRTYLSDYFTNILHTTFYDYINRLRIEKQSVPLMQDHPDYTLERIASESGFQSISTFRRSFQKLKGVSPSEYRKQKK